MIYNVAHIVRQYVLTLSGAAHTISRACGKGKGGSMFTRSTVPNSFKSAQAHKSEGLAIPEVAQSRVCPRKIAGHELDWSHAIQFGQDQLMIVSFLLSFL